MTKSNRREFLNRSGKYILGAGLATAVSAIISGCKTMEAVTKIGTSLAVSQGLIDESQAESISKGASAVARSFQDITPEQEYYIGRTVGAMITAKYRPYDNPQANMFLNVLGQVLAQASELPETFGGYHFLILGSDEINAFAAPGGLIFVTRGMLRCCEHEDAVAAVLAHEIGHVQLKHGLQAIEKSRVTSAVTTLAIEGGKSFDRKNVVELTRTFENSISDITAALINNGYSRAFEREADKAAVKILKNVGYDPNGLVDMLNVMKGRLKPGRLDFARTHPPPAIRIAALRKHIGRYSGVKTSGPRQPRFMAVFQNI